MKKYFAIIILVALASRAQQTLIIRGGGSSGGFTLTSQSAGSFLAPPCGTSGMPIWRLACTSDLPSVSITSTYVVSSQADMLALGTTQDAEQGDVAVRTDMSKTYILAANPASVLANWIELLRPPDLVSSVNGQTGTVILTVGNISGAENTANKNAAGGYPGLDGSIKIAASQVPTLNQNTTGTAGALAVNGTNCSAGQVALGVDASGNAEGCYAPTSATVGLGNVTNNAQTNAAILPNTAPSSGQIPVGNAGGTAYAPVSASGDATIAQTGAIALKNTGVGSGSCTACSVTFDAQGRETTYSSGTSFTPPTGTGVVTVTGGALDAASTAFTPNATASTIVSRDTSANTRANSHIDGYTTTVTAAATTTLTVASTKIQFFTGSTTQTVVLPVASTLVLGQEFNIINQSSGALTVNSSGSNLVLSMPGTSTAKFVCVLVSGTSAASWTAVPFARTDAQGVFTSLQVNGNATANGYLNSKTDVYVGDFAIGITKVASNVLGVGGGAGSVSGTVRSTYYEMVAGSNVTSASTIAPTSGLFHVTGTTQITTISLPRIGFTGCLRIIPDASGSTATGGNIALGTTFVPNKLLEECYDGTLWYPSY